MLAKRKAVLENRVVGVLVDLSEGSAIKFVAHRGYDKLLCDHVYFRFCLDACMHVTRSPFLPTLEKGFHISLVIKFSFSQFPANISYNKTGSRRGVGSSAFSFLVKCVLSLVDRVRFFFGLFGLYFFDWLWRWCCSHGPSYPGADA